MQLSNKEKETRLSVEERVESLLQQMTLAEKIGQMTQAEKNSITPVQVTEYSIGSVLSGGGGNPTPNNPQTWFEMTRGFLEAALQTRLRIPLFYGSDAVHGHSNVNGAVIFPHNIGLGATRDADLVERLAQINAIETLATGVHWSFAPAVSVPQDIRWGRTFEGFSERPDVVSELAKAFVRGLQAPSKKHPNSATALASVKHFLADGGTQWGSQLGFDPTTATWTTKNSRVGLDQGDSTIDEATLRAIHLPPYLAAIKAGAMNIMVSYSSWHGLRMHGHKYLLTDVLKGEFGFDGFLVSDWMAVDQVAETYYDSVVKSINAGIDMVMVPFRFKEFISALTQAVEKGDVAMSRIDDAVRRILRVKLRLGLFENPLTDKTWLANIGLTSHRQVAREAVRKSAVLLKNENNILPLMQDTPTIFVAGKSANDLGLQCGGWTIEWGGHRGNIMPGTTFLDALKTRVSSSTTLVYDLEGNFKESYGIADIGIAVVGEIPYVEGTGDRADLALSDEDVEAINQLRQRCKKLLIVLYSGRPMIITDQIEQCDALVAAWLPGSEANGLTDVLFGDHPFTGKLSYTWPRSMAQIPLKALLKDQEPPLFPFGYGLTLEKVASAPVSER